MVGESYELRITPSPVQEALLDLNMKHKIQPDVLWPDLDQGAHPQVGLLIAASRQNRHAAATVHRTCGCDGLQKRNIFPKTSF